MVVRNAMEDFHCQHLTDEQMKELNPIIRNAIYTALYAIHNGDDEPWCQRCFEHHLKMIPPYWEAPELLEGTRRMRERGQAGETAKPEPSAPATRADRDDSVAGRAAR